jgi:hypothetical protein
MSSSTDLIPVEPDETLDLIGAREDLLRAALHVLSAERIPDRDPHQGAQLDYADDRLGRAAVALAAAMQRPQPASDASPAGPARSLVGTASPEFPAPGSTTSGGQRGVYTDFVNELGNPISIHIDTEGFGIGDAPNVVQVRISGPGSEGIWNLTPLEARTLGETLDRYKRREAQLREGA